MDAKWHLVNVSPLRVVVLLTSPNYRTPIGRTDGTQEPIPERLPACRGSLTCLFVFNDQGGSFKMFAFPPVP